MILDFLREFSDGVLASVQGFLKILKLDQAQNATEKPQNTQRASSAEPTPQRMTVLERRRKQELEKKKERKSTPSPPVVMRTKMPASYRVAQVIMRFSLFLEISLIVIMNNM